MEMTIDEKAGSEEDRNAFQENKTVNSPVA